MAKLVDFDYVTYNEPKRLGGVLDLIIGEATFCIKGEGDDYAERSADFWDAVEELKEVIPGCQRAWDDDEKLWTVQVTHPVQQDLFAIFTNAESAFEDTEELASLW